MKIKIETEEELVAAFKKLLHISVNMRHWQKEYGMHFGSALRVKKNDWEWKFDKMMEELGVEEIPEQVHKKLF